jgi:hypothetical protein
VEAELLVAEQIARLFHARQAVVWDLVEAPHSTRPQDVAIRDAQGALVVLARPTAA